MSDGQIYFFDSKPRTNALQNSSEVFSAAQLVFIIPNLVPKMGFHSGVTAEGLGYLTNISCRISARFNRLSYEVIGSETPSNLG